MTEDELQAMRLKTGSPTFGKMNAPEPVYDPDAEMFTLRARDLFDKGGFCDGDLFIDQFLDYCHKKGIRRPAKDGRYWYSQVLRDLVETHLLPLIPFNLKLEVVPTCHNSVRCFEVEGVAEDQLNAFRDTCEGVEVALTWRQIREFVDDKIGQGLLVSQ